MNWSETLQNLARRPAAVWSSVNLKAIRGSIRHPFAIGYIYSGWCFVGALWWLKICSQKSFWWDIIRCTNCKAACIDLHPKTVCSRHFHNTKNTVLQETKGCNIILVIVFESLRSGEQRADTIGGSRQYPWCWNHQVGKQPLHPWRLELCSSQLLCQGAPDEDTNKSWSKSIRMYSVIVCWVVRQKVASIYDVHRYWLWMMICIDMYIFIPLMQIDLKWVCISFYTVYTCKCINVCL